MEERHRIAAEIHDGLAQILSYLELEVEELVDRIERDLAENPKDELFSIREAVRQAGEEARKSITRLHEEIPMSLSLQDQLEMTVSEHARIGDFKITLNAEVEEPLKLAHSDASHILRILQEALNNAHRHARSRQVAVSLKQHRQEYVLTVEDDGVGFDPGAPHQNDRSHFGLSIMKARANRLQGDLEVISRIGKGTRVILTWPAEILEPVNLFKALEG